MSESTSPPFKLRVGFRDLALGLILLLVSTHAGQTKTLSCLMAWFMEKAGPDAIPESSNAYIVVCCIHRRTDMRGKDADDFEPKRWKNLHAGREYVILVADHGYV